MQDARPKIVDAPLMFILHRCFRYRWYHISLSTWPIRWLRITIVAQPLTYARCKTKNRWCCFDVHFQEIIAKSLLTFFGWKVADSWNMGKCHCTAVGLCKTQDRKSLTLRWRSFLGDSHNVVASIFGLKGGRYVKCGQISINSPWIIQNAWPKIVDAQLMLISRMG